MWLRKPREGTQMVPLLHLRLTQTMKCGSIVWFLMTNIKLGNTCKYNSLGTAHKIEEDKLCRIGFKYSEVRQEIINALRTDLMGPQSGEWDIGWNPKSSYILSECLFPRSKKENLPLLRARGGFWHCVWGFWRIIPPVSDDDNEPIWPPASSYQLQSV